MGIDNTTRRMREDAGEKLAFLGESLVTGSAETFIAGQERAGQAQLVNSDRLPTDRGDDAQWLELGFTFGEPDPNDPMFCPATLPPGWTRKGSDHAMWSHLLDGHGRQRASIFYKAAFYDRSARMSMGTLYSYASAVAEGECPLVLDEWATRDGVLEALREHADQWREYEAGARRRGDAEGAEQDEAYAVKFEAVIAKLEAEAVVSDG